MKTTMIKRFMIFTASLLLAAAGCTKEEDFVCDSPDGLIKTGFTAGYASDDPESKAYTHYQDSHNYAFWSKGDAVGVMAGSANPNRKFTLCGDGGSTSGKFEGYILPQSSPVSMWLYYPYTEDVTDGYVPVNSLATQEFKGTFEEQGSFYNYGEHAFCVCYGDDVDISSGIPSGFTAKFNTLTAVVRYKISNDLEQGLTVKSVSLTSSEKAFIFPTYFVPQDNGYYGLSRYQSYGISTSISSDNKLYIGPSGTAYVQMVAFPNSFSDGEALKVGVNCITSDGRSVQYTVPKTVQSSNSFVRGKRTTISAPISSSTSCSYAYRVKVTTTDTATSLTAPMFVRSSSDYQNADAWWGDGEYEDFCAEKTHDFGTAGERTASFNHWGGSSMVTFKQLTNISEIDFTQAQ